MAPYQYPPLDPSQRDIRVFHLHPGSAKDPICISISHAPFRLPDTPYKTRTTRKDLQRLQKKLPDDWLAWRTIEGRAIFQRVPGGEDSEEEDSEEEDLDEEEPSEEELDQEDSDDESEEEASDEKGEAKYQMESEEGFYCSWMPPVPIRGFNSDEGDNFRRQTATPSFEAVSYMWGSVDTLVGVEVVNSEDLSENVGTISVGPSLYEMLRYLRQQEGSRTLWVDAICINQSDLTERGEQVKEMHNIYTFASRVIVWVGEATEDSELALTTLEYIGKQIEYTTEQYLLPAPGRTEKDWWETRYRIPLTPAALVAIANLIQRPYFERLWVLQEIQLANDLSIIRCGDKEVLWYYVRRGFAKCQLDTAGLTPFSSPLMQQKMAHIDSLASDLRNSGYVDLFHMAWYCACVNPRDKLYSLLGLLPESIAKRIEPQYSQPMELIYSQAFLNCVDATKRLDLLDVARGIDTAVGIPTWVPGLEKPKNLAFGSLTNFASSLSGAHVSTGMVGELLVQGVAQDDVEIVSPITPDNTSGIYKAARELNSIKDGSGLKMTEDEFIEAFLWLFCFGELQDRFVEVESFPTLESAIPMIQQIQNGEEPTVEGTYQNWYQAGLLNTMSKRFFITRKGHLGCGFAEVEPGDKVCVFLGYGDPIVLRPESSDKESMKFKIVGRSYVHGLMEGQALLGPIPGPWEMVVKSSDLEPPFDSADAVFFFNTKTCKTNSRDPRLAKLPQEWKAIEKNDDVNLGNHPQYHMNKDTGEVINSDPRLLPEALKARGVPIETFVLI